MESPSRKVHHLSVKKRLVRASAMVALGLGVALGPMPIAFAKGATQAVIRGPGITHPITVTDPDEIQSLDEWSGFAARLWPSGCSQYHGCVRRPSGDLGTPYIVAYTMFSNEKVVQFIYPSASAGPTTYVPAGQKYLGHQRTVGGWFVAGRSLSQTLADLGVPSPGPLVSGGTNATDQRSSSRLPWLLILVAILGSLTAIAAGLRSTRKRRELLKTKAARLSSHLPPMPRSRNRGSAQEIERGNRG